MGKRGRFGKYGESKRIARLRAARIGPCDMLKRGINETRSTAIQKSKASQKPHLEIRSAEAPDVEFILTLSKKAFQQYGPYDEMLPHWFLSGSTITFLALIEKTPVGFAMLNKPDHTSSFPHMCELLAIAVEPDRRRLHVADLLMKQLEKTASKLKIEMLILHTAVDNVPGQRLFKKHGFTPSGIKDGFYPEGQDALMMCKDICN